MAGGAKQSNLYYRDAPALARRDTDMWNLGTILAF